MSDTRRYKGHEKLGPNSGEKKNRKNISRLVEKNGRRWLCGQLQMTNTWIHAHKEFGGDPLGTICSPAVFLKTLQGGGEYIYTLILKKL